MPSTETQARPIPSDDELDDILNGIAQGRDIAQSNGGQAQAERPNVRKTGTAEALGIDEEIIITKTRLPIPKLNDERLLSDPGIPRLRKISKERLRFKGKGHEYGDIARMLNMYQLWLDDLYPRAKFADALAIIEKVGHTKRMQIMRKDWINEGKPKRSTEDDDDDVDEVLPNAAKALQDEEMVGIEKDGTAARLEVELGENNRPLHQSHPGEEAAASDNPDEDELDMLLAENAESDHARHPTLPSRPAVAEHDPFADEMEAMADMEGMW